MALSTPFAWAALALGIALWLRRSWLESRGAGPPLALGGAGFAVLVAGERAAAALAPASPAAAALRALAALGALAAWGGIAGLAFRRARRRDLFWIVPFGLLAAFDLAAARPFTGLALVLSLPVVGRWRWLDDAGRRASGWALAAAFVVPVLAFAPLPGDPGATGAPGFALVRFAAWARELAGLYLALALPGLLVRWSVGIQRVSRRLALLLLLSGVVPVALILVIWGATTQLGVRAERALFASRLVEQAAGTLGATLRAAAGSDDPAAVVAAAQPRWPGLRVWRNGTRLRGAPLADDAALRAWPDSLPQSGFVRLGGGAFLGARAATRSDTLVALVPIEQVLRSDIQPALDARLGLLSEVAPDTVAGRGGTVVTLDSPGRRPAAAGSGGLHLRFGERRVISGREFRMTAGHGLVNGIAWSDGAWEHDRALLSADVRWGAIALGLARTARENPMNYLPLFFIALIALLIVMIAGADFGMVRTLGRSITAAIAALRQGAGRLEAGELSYRIPVGGEDDLWEVAGAFNRMAAGLERGRQLEIERERIESELALARRIQARLLPAGPPPVQGLELAGTSEPAREVGGDYYDYLALGPGRVALVIADVSGKGVGAALLMSAFRASLLSQDLAGGDLAATAGRLNQFLHRSVEPGRFVTAFLAVLDGATGRMRYCNAGHNAPIVIRPDGAVRRLEAGGLILGILPDSAYETGETVLEFGDRLVLFTDGVTEAANERDEQWEEERLLAVLQEDPGSPCAEVVGRIVERVRRFEGSRGASDDVTLIVARRAPAGG